jgi:hypothetical protein
VTIDDESTNVTHDHFIRMEGDGTPTAALSRSVMPQ